MGGFEVVNFDDKGLDLRYQRLQGKILRIKTVSVPGTVQVDRLYCQDANTTLSDFHCFDHDVKADCSHRTASCSTLSAWTRFPPHLICKMKHS